MKKTLNLLTILFAFTVFISCDSSDDTTPCEEKTWYEDKDGDGKGNPDVYFSACEQPDGYVLDNTDDNDSIDNSKSIYMDLLTYTHTNRSSSGKVYETYVYTFENGKTITEGYNSNPTNSLIMSNYEYDTDNLIKQIRDDYGVQEKYIFEDGKLNKIVYDSGATDTYYRTSSNLIVELNNYKNSPNVKDNISFDDNSRVIEIIRESYPSSNERSYKGVFKYNDLALESIEKTDIKYDNNEYPPETQTFENMVVNPNNFYSFWNNSLYGNNIFVDEWTDCDINYFINFSLDYISGISSLNGEPIFEIRTEFDSKNRITKRTYYALDRENTEDWIEEFTYRN